MPLFESRGISTTWATGLLSLMAGISILTRIGLAAVADRARGFEMICLIVTGCGVITNALLLSSTSVGVLAGFLIVWSIADGGPSLVEPLAVTHTFGMGALRHDPGEHRRYPHGGHADLYHDCGRDLRCDRLV